MWSIVQVIGVNGSQSHSHVEDTLRGLSAVFVDETRAFIDNGAVHGKSQLERSLQFAKEQGELIDPHRVWGVWVTLKHFNQTGQGFHGAMPFSLWIDAAGKVGYKSLAEQVNQMERAIQSQVALKGLSQKERSILKDFLKLAASGVYWENATREFREAFED
ncbi:hypothetical protein D2Q93_01620 [Alicyclobacillaceae bacterium I2511]|nr:hypothetical protein D2Q93_01620 [Alicyclobacillaceae bacterium I2511]